MTADIVDLSAARARRAEQAAANASEADPLIYLVEYHLRGQDRWEPALVWEPRFSKVGAALAEVLEVPESELTWRFYDPPKPIRWRASAKGNFWTKVGLWHIVIYPDRGDTDRWCARLQYGSRVIYSKHAWPSAEEAQYVMELTMRKREASMREEARNDAFYKPTSVIAFPKPARSTPTG
jgi:hypothetical protein